MKPKEEAVCFGGPKDGLRIMPPLPLPAGRFRVEPGGCLYQLGAEPELKWMGDPPDEMVRVWVAQYVPAKSNA